MAGRKHYDNRDYLELQGTLLTHFRVFSIKETAERMGVSEAMMNRYLKGLSPVPIDQFHNAARKDEYMASYYQSYLKGLAGG